MRIRLDITAGTRIASCVLRPALLLLALTTAACEGEIGNAGGARSGSGAPFSRLPGSSGTGPAGDPNGFPGSSGDDGPATPPDVNRVAIHRLNNAEYDNTMHDLLGVTSSPGKSFI